MEMDNAGWPSSWDMTIDAYGYKQYIWSYDAIIYKNICSMCFTSVYTMWNIGSLIKVNYISCGIYTFKAHGTYIFVYNGIVWPNVLFVPICIIGHISWGWPTCIVHLPHYMLPASPLVISHLDDQPVPSISITIWYMYHHWSYLIRMA